MWTELAIYFATIVVGIAISILCAKWLRGETTRNFWLEALAASIAILVLLLVSMTLHPLLYGGLVLFVFITGRSLASLVAESSRGGIILGVFFGTWLSFGVVAARFVT